MSSSDQSDVASAVNVDTAVAAAAAAGALIDDDAELPFYFEMDKYIESDAGRDQIYGCVENYLGTSAGQDAIGRHFSTDVGKALVASLVQPASSASTSSVGSSAATVKSSAAAVNLKTTRLGNDAPSKLGLVPTMSSAGSPTTLTTPSKLGIPANISTPTSAGSNNSKKRSLGSIDLTSGQPDSPHTKWDAIIGRVTNATSKSKWHPKSVPTL